MALAVGKIVRDWKQTIATMKGVETICATCLSSDRKMYPVEQISKQLTYDFRLLPQDKVCWECRAQMNKFIQFRARVITAQKTIKLLVNGQVQRGAVKSLSSLGLKTLPESDRSYCQLEGTLEQKTEVYMHVTEDPKLEIKQDPLNIKIEPFEDEPYEEPLSTFEIGCEQYYQPSIDKDRNSFTHNVNTTERDARGSNSNNFKVYSGPPIVKTKQNTVLKKENTSGLDVEDNLMTKFTIRKTPVPIITRVPTSNASENKSQSVIPVVPYTVPISVSNLESDLVPILVKDKNLKTAVVKLQKAAPKRSMTLEVPPLMPTMPKLTPKPMLKLTPKPGLLDRPSVPSERPSVPPDGPLDPLDPGPSKSADYKYDYLESTTHADGSVVVQDIQCKGKKCILKKDAYYSKRCTEEELANQRQKLRERILFKSCPYKCETCIEYFPGQDKLDKHNETLHKPENSFVCETCAQRFSDEEKLKEHKKLHEWYYVCSSCNFTRHRQYRVEAHYKSVHRESNIECRKCNMVFPTFIKYKLHRKTHEKEQHNCHLCAATFRNSHKLNVHLETHVSPEKPAEFKCTLCPKEFRGYKLFCLHMKKHEKKPEAPQYCYECSKIFQTYGGYKQHMKARHEPIQEKKLKFECDYCGAKFASITHIRDHIEMVHCPVPKYPCIECSLKFMTIKRLRSHIRRKHQKKEKLRVLCDLCGKNFDNRKTLEQHRNSHLGLRPYLCPYCPADFSFSGALYTHAKLKHKCKLPPLAERQRLVQERLAMANQGDTAEKNGEESGQDDENGEENVTDWMINADPDYEESDSQPRKRQRRKETKTSTNKKGAKRSRIEKFY